MTEKINALLKSDIPPNIIEGFTERRRQAILHKTGALQNALFNSAHFSSIATDANGVIQIFNVGAERMLGYTAVEVINKVTLAYFFDSQENSSGSTARYAATARSSRSSRVDFAARDGM